MKTGDTVAATVLASSTMGSGLLAWLNEYATVVSLTFTAIGVITGCIWGAVSTYFRYKDHKRKERQEREAKEAALKAMHDKAQEKGLSQDQIELLTEVLEEQ